jgi:hypothetical protein
MILAAGSRAGDVHATSSAVRRHAALLGLAGLAVALLLVAPAASAFNTTDGAGIRGLDTASGGPTTAGFIHLESTCGVACKKTLADETVLNVCPPAGGANSWTFRWSSAASAVYNGALACSATNRLAAAHSNGFISFTSGTICSGAACYTSTSLPTSGAPNAAVYAAWHDLYPSAPFGIPGAVYVQAQGTSPNRVMVIEYLNVPWACWQDGAETFEFKLFESDNHVEVIYLNQVAGTVDSFCTPYQYVRGGQENSLGSRGVQYFGGTGVYSPPSNVAIAYADVVSPTVNLPTVACGVAGLNGWCRSATNSVTVTDNDFGSGGVTGFGVGTRQLLVDGVGAGAYSNGAPTSLTLAEGVHTVQGKATDWAGNIGTGTSVNLKADSTAPAVAISLACTLNGAGACVDPANLGISGSDATSGLNTLACTLDGQAVACASGDTLVVAAAGPHDLVVTATDLAGNAASATRHFELALDPPVITLDSACDLLGLADWCRGVQTILADASDAGSGLAEGSPACTLDGDASACGLAVAAQGAHTFVISATNNNGLTATATLEFSIDSIAPSLTPARDPLPNADGWVNAPVTVSFACADEGSGIGSVTPEQVLADDGASQNVAGVCVDAAGNAAEASVEGIAIDQAAPMLLGSRTPEANVAGWNNGPVTISWACADALSGVAALSPDEEMALEGLGQSAIGACTDLAGNAASASVDGVNIDLTPPSIALSSRLPPPNANGWNNGPVTLTWDCDDALSGREAASITQTLAGEGADQSASATCADLAGNTAGDTQGGVSIDLLGPVISLGSRVPGPNADGWNNAPVTLTWACSDASSGVVEESVVQTLADEGSMLSATGVCEDEAGNTADASVTDVRIDLTPPSILGSFSPPLNAAGWTNLDVTVSWSCDDALAGVGILSPGEVLAMEGTGLSASGMCSDLAGNTADATVGGINLDKTPPGIALADRTPANAQGWNNGPVSVSWVCNDALSGPATDTVGQLLASEGLAQEASGLCADLAGNTATDTLGDVHIDLTSPVLSGAAAPAPNPHGWNNVDVTVSWACEDALAGVETVSPPEVLADEGSSLVASGSCNDLAGNGVEAAVGGINLDKTPPAIVASRSPAANAHGWNNGPVTASFACSDALSGLDGVAPDVVLASEGDAQSASGACSDLAGNSASSGVDGVRIDLTPPALDAAMEGLEGAHGWWRSAVDVSLECADALAGLPGSPIVYAVNGGAESAYEQTFSIATQGPNQVDARCADLADNEVGRSEVVRVDTIAPFGNVASPLLAAGLYGVDWLGSDAISGPDEVLIEERPLLATPGVGFTPVCTLALGGANATGACMRDPQPQVYCYRVTITDIAGNTYASPNLDVEVGFDPETLALSLRSTCTVKVSPGTTGVDAAMGPWSCVEGTLRLECLVLDGIVAALTDAPAGPDVAVATATRTGANR